MQAFSQNIFTKLFVISFICFLIFSCKTDQESNEPTTKVTSSELKPSVNDAANKTIKKQIAQKHTQPDKNKVAETKADNTKISDTRTINIQSANEVSLSPKTIIQAQKQLNIKKLYKVTWMGVNVAYFYADISSKNNITNFVFRSKSVGFIDRFIKFLWNSDTKMRFDGKKYTPVFVNRDAKLKKKGRNIKISYDAAGNIISDVTTPPENPKKRPPVSTNLKNKTYDALTMMLEGRNRVIDIFEQNKFDGDSAKFTMKLYDGRRLSDISVEVFNKVEDNLFKLRVIQTPIAGYTNNELNELKTDGKRYIDIYVDRTNFTTVKATGKSAMGSASAQFIKDCTGGFEECLK